MLREGQHDLFRKPHNRPHSPKHLSVRELGEGVDLDLSRVLLLEDLVQLVEHIGSVVLGALLESELLGERFGVGMADSVLKVKSGGDDSLGGVVSDILNVHTSLVGGDEDGGTSCSVVEDGSVVLLLRGHSLGEHDGVADSTGGTSLLGDELVTEHLRGKVLCLSGTA